jgi:lipopolysaccharide heptosyltransferase II
MKEPKSILVVTLSNIGDVVMTTPVIMTLAARFPEARITAVVGPKAKSVLEKSGAISRIVVYDKKAGLLAKWEFLKELWKDRYDWVVDLRNTAIPFLVPCKKRSPLFRKFTKVNMRERHLEVLKMMAKGDRHLFPEGKGACPLFKFFDQEDERGCLAKLKEKGISDERGWILVAPGAASGRKRWPADSFCELTRELSIRAGKKVLLVGSKDERLIAEEISKRIPLSCLVLCGELSLSETSFLISRSALVVANDSAIMHIGFETGTPTIGLFGPTDHEKYGHEGKNFRIAREDAAKCGCHSDQIPYAERNCFHGLMPSKVLALCSELLK